MIKLREGLRARGHEVRLLTSDALLVPGWPYAADALCRGTIGRAQPYLQTWNPSAAAAVRNEVERFRPDVAHIRMFLWQLSPAILRPLRSVPTLYQAAVYKAVCPTGLKVLPGGQPCTERAGLACLRNGCVSMPTWISAMLQLQLLRRDWGAIDQVVALSADMAMLLERNGIPEVGVIHNGIDTRPMRPPLAGPPTIAYAGRLNREKGVDILIEAFARVRRTLPDSRLWIAGSGPLQTALEQRVSELGIAEAVDFLGYLQQDELDRRFEPAWVQVAPSIWQEPFGNVALEAMMRGTAFIGSGGFADIVENGVSGFLTAPASVDDLAEALGRILGDRQMAETMGRAGYERANRSFSQTAVIDAFESLYGTLRRRDSS